MDQRGGCQGSHGGKGEYGQRLNKGRQSRKENIGKEGGHGGEGRDHKMDQDELPKGFQGIDLRDGLDQVKKRIREKVTKCLTNRLARKKNDSRGDLQLYQVQMLAHSSKNIP